jgi:hypothetical protein
MMVTLRPIRSDANITFIYYHQRIRLEGYDIEWRMDAPDMNSPAPARKQDVAKEIAALEGSQG